VNRREILRPRVRSGCARCADSARGARAHRHALLEGRISPNAIERPDAGDAVHADRDCLPLCAEISVRLSVKTSTVWIPCLRTFETKSSPLSLENDESICSCSRWMFVGHEIQASARSLSIVRLESAM